MEALIPISLFLSVAAVLIFRGPFGKAMAERLAGRQAPGPESERLRAEVEELRYRLAELEERVDFSERLLARGREAERSGSA